MGEEPRELEYSVSYNPSLCFVNATYPLWLELNDLEYEKNGKTLNSGRVEKNKGAL